MKKSEWSERIDDPRPGCLKVPVCSHPSGYGWMLCDFGYAEWFVETDGKTLAKWRRAEAAFDNFQEEIDDAVTLGPGPKCKERPLIANVRKEEG